MHFEYLGLLISWSRLMFKVAMNVMNMVHEDQISVYISLCVCVWVVGTMCGWREAQTDRELQN